MKVCPCGLYVILDVDICASCGDIVEIARKTILGGADILQLRAKKSSDREILKIGQAIKNLLHKSKALFVLNDRADLAQALDADGMHLGQQDLPVKDARRILGKDKIIGVSTHSVSQAQEAEKLGADYIAIGPIFATATKPDLAPLGTQSISQVKDKIKIPFVAIGGIDLNNLDEVSSAGAKGVAVCRAIITAGDVFKAARKFRERLRPLL